MTYANKKLTHHTHFRKFCYTLQPPNIYGIFSKMAWMVHLDILMHLTSWNDECER